MKTRVKIIVNPKSGVGKQQNIANHIQLNLDNNKFDWELLFTKYRGHAKNIAKDAVRNKIDLVIAVGGDGTVNEIGSELVNTQTALGIVPAGSGNGLARHLGIFINIEKAIKTFNNHRIKEIDVGSLNEHFFFNTAGIGFDALIAAKFLNLKKRGLISYIKTTLRTYFNYQTKNYEISIGNKELKANAFLIAFANSSQYGNHATIAPGAKIDDGLLNMCMLKSFGILSVPILAYRLFNGSIDKSNKMEIIENSNFKVNIDNKSFVHVDGEPLKLEGIVEISIYNKALKIVVPI